MTRVISDAKISDSVENKLIYTSRTIRCCSMGDCEVIVISSDTESDSVQAISLSDSPSYSPAAGPSTSRVFTPTKRPPSPSSSSR